MKILISAVAGIVFIVGLFAYRPSDEDEVRQAVQSFNAAFNAHDFRSAEEYTTEDWNHINPFGGSTRGRDAVLKELRLCTRIRRDPHFRLLSEER
jgi:ketosteroid isomerase-like protein